MRHKFDVFDNRKIMYFQAENTNSLHSPRALKSASFGMQSFDTCCSRLSNLLGYRGHMVYSNIVLILSLWCELSVAVWTVFVQERTHLERKDRRPGNWILTLTCCHVKATLFLNQQTWICHSKTLPRLRQHCCKFWILCPFRWLSTNVLRNPSVRYSYVTVHTTLGSLSICTYSPFHKYRAKQKASDMPVNPLN